MGRRSSYTARRFNRVRTGSNVLELKCSVIRHTYVTFAILLLALQNCVCSCFQRRSLGIGESPRSMFARSNLRETRDGRDLFTIHDDRCHFRVVPNAFQR